MKRSRKGLRRRYGHAASKSGWASGRRPSHSEIWAHGKPIEIRKDPHDRARWNVFVMGEPVMQSKAGLTFRGRSDYDNVAAVATIAKFKKGDAQYIAHKIGHYMLDLGNFVDTYTEGY